MLLLLLLQADPAIDSVERLAGEARRPLLWAPLAVKMSSKAGFEGDIVVRSRFGFSVARRVKVPAGGSVREILPSLDSESVELGGARSVIPNPRAAPDLVVAVDARLPFAADLASSERVHYVRVAVEDLRPLLAGGLLEAADLVLISDAAGLELGGPCAWAVVRTREEAERAAAGARPAVRIEARDAAAWLLRPADAWVPAKRARAALFAGLYGFAGFATVALAARRGGRAVAAAVGVLVLLGVVGVAVLLPRGQLFVEEHPLTIVHEEGPATEWRLRFAVSPAAGPLRIRFPRLVRPVFPGFEGTDRAFTLRVEERGCVVEGLELGPGHAAAFVSAAGRPAPSSSTPLRAAWTRMGGQFRPLGDVALGASPSREITSLGGEPRDPAYGVWKRFLDGDVLFGRSGGGEAVEDLESPDLADARQGEGFVIRRLR